MYLDNNFDDAVNSDMENLHINGDENSPKLAIPASGFLSPNVDSNSNTPVSSPILSPSSPSTPTSKKSKSDKRTSFNRFLHKKSNSETSDTSSGFPANTPPYHYNTPTYKGLAEIKLDNDNILDSMKEEFFFMMSCDEPDSVALRFLRAR